MRPLLGRAARGVRTAESRSERSLCRVVCNHRAACGIDEQGTCPRGDGMTTARRHSSVRHCGDKVLPQPGLRFCGLQLKATVGRHLLVTSRPVAPSRRREAAAASPPGLYVPAQGHGLSVSLSDTRDRAREIT